MLTSVDVFEDTLQLTVTAQGAEMLLEDEEELERILQLFRSLLPLIVVKDQVDTNKDV